MLGIWSGSAGPDMKERVQPFLAKNSSRMGTPRCDCLLLFLSNLPLPTTWSFSSSVCLFTSEKVASPLLLHSCSGLFLSEVVVAVSWSWGFENYSFDFLKDCVMRAISPVLSLSSGVEMSPKVRDSPESDVSSRGPS